MAIKRKKKTQVIEKKPSLKRTIAELNRKYGDNTIGFVSSMKNLSVERISTGISVLDNALGGGLPRGRIVEFFGVPASGKSLISLLTIKQAQQLRLDCIYINAEESFDPDFAKKMGVDIDKLIITQLSIGEDIIDIIAKLLSSQPAIIVIDSVAAMIARNELIEPMDQQFMALKARLMSRGLAKINALNKSTILLFINQLRSNLSVYHAPSTTTGGRALPHYASVRIEVKQGDKLTGANKDDIIGQVIQFKIAKNKVGIPYKKGSFKFLYENCQIEE